MEFQDIRGLLDAEMAELDQIIDKQLATEVPLISTICKHIIYSGGKRLRPLLVLLTARALNALSPAQLELAVIIEFIHTATLLHDDVVDGSVLRRGAETANTLWGNQAAVLVGDFLLSRSFEMMVGINNMALMDVLSHATNVISAGEVQQLANKKKPETTEETYIAVIRAKTAMLFAAATRGAGLLARAEDKELINQLAEFGLNIGTAFQLVDDALDYQADSHTLGKNIGDDLAEGKPTLPLIYAMAQGSASERELIVDAIMDSSLDNLPAILKIIESSGAIAYTYDRAKAYAKLAKNNLAVLPDTVFSQGLCKLCDFAVARAY